MLYALIIIGVIIIVLNVRAMKNDKTSFKGALNSAEENMAEFDVKIGAVRREFSETILELQKEVEELKDFVKRNTKVNNNNGENNNRLTNHEENLALLSRELDKQDIYEHSDRDFNKENSNSNQYLTDDESDEDTEINDGEQITNQIEQANNNNGGNKIADIEELLKQGLSLDEISVKLGIGKGEVLLIKELYLK